MSGMQRNLLIAVAFVALVGLFVFVQREAPESTAVPATHSHDHALDNPEATGATSPQVDRFEATASEPVRVLPDGQSVSDAEPAVAERSSGLPAGTAGQGASLSASPDQTAPQRQIAAPAVSANNAGSGQPTSITNTPGAVPGATGSRGPGEAIPGASAGPGPGESVDPAEGVKEMISLPPSGPGPEALPPGVEAVAPEHSNPPFTQGPEAGAAGPGEPPELLPVTTPGPSGEMPGEPVNRP